MVHAVLCPFLSMELLEIRVERFPERVSHKRSSKMRDLLCIVGEYGSILSARNETWDSNHLHEGKKNKLQSKRIFETVFANNNLGRYHNLDKAAQFCFLCFTENVAGIKFMR